MERSVLKKWVRPGLDALPSPKASWIGFLFLLWMLWIMVTPWLDRLIYPLKYEHLILNSAEATGADPFLVMAIIRAESQFQPEEESAVGAQGLMQLMPETLDWMIQRGGFSPALREYIRDPAINIHMGSWYISYLTKRYNGNKVAVMAAYNCGHNRVTRWLNQGVWDGTRQGAARIPIKETREYVYRVSFYYQKYKECYQHLLRDDQHFLEDQQL
ncbi:lytic transglycosylase domain-containing protein [Laceyella putida]|uniref:Lytic transglycosylase domain-containing protein n=1 Tax=Laceyella putida TaxID=110101 RepID=A0ABW2RPR7_9BACL